MLGHFELKFFVWCFYENFSMKKSQAKQNKTRNPKCEKLDLKAMEKICGHRLNPCQALSNWPDYDLRWCYTGQLATPTCNGVSQHMFFARICRHVTLFNRFQKCPMRCSTVNIAKNRPQRGVALERFFARHRIIASWRCKLTSVTPPLDSREPRCLTATIFLSEI